MRRYLIDARVVTSLVPRLSDREKELVKREPGNEARVVT